jgi:elongation factor P--beta-lysine ligase
MYINGIEIANGNTENTDTHARSEFENSKKYQECLWMKSFES